MCPCCGANGVYTANAAHTSNSDSSNTVVCTACAKIGYKLDLTGFYYVNALARQAGGWRTRFVDSVCKIKEYRTAERENSAAATNALIPHICACCGVARPNLDKTPSQARFICSDCWLDGKAYGIPFVCEIYLSNGYVVTSAALHALVEHRKQRGMRVAERQSAAPPAASGAVSRMPPACAGLRQLLKETPAAPAESPPTEQRPQWNFCEGEVAWTTWTTSPSPTAPSRATVAPKKAPSSSPRERLAWALFCTLVEEDAEVVARCEIAPNASEQERSDRIKTVADRLWSAQPPHRLRTRAENLAAGVERHSALMTATTGKAARWL